MTYHYCDDCKHSALVVDIDSDNCNVRHLWCGHSVNIMEVSK